MTCTRSVYSWDIIATRIGDKIFFDKRDGSSLDMPTVDENAAEQPSANESTLNAPLPLAAEAALVNSSFLQKTLKGVRWLPSLSVVATFPTKHVAVTQFLACHCGIGRQALLRQTQPIPRVQIRICLSQVESWWRPHGCRSV